MPDDGFDPHNHEWPECEKLSSLVRERDAITEFLEWLNDEHDIQLCSIPDGYEHTYLAVSKSHFDLVHDFLGIDQRKLEEERRAMLAQYH